MPGKREQESDNVECKLEGWYRGGREGGQK
jgi:hypothetical protein